MITRSILALVLGLALTVTAAGCGSRHRGGAAPASTFGAARFDEATFE